MVSVSLWSLVARMNTPVWLRASSTQARLVAANPVILKLMANWLFATLGSATSCINGFTYHFGIQLQQHQAGGKTAQLSLGIRLTNKASGTQFGEALSSRVLSLSRFFFGQCLLLAVAGLFAAHQQPTLRDPGIIRVLPTAMIAIAQSGQRLCTYGLPRPALPH